jgi:hypothetical protein
LPRALSAGQIVFKAAKHKNGMSVKKQNILGHVPIQHLADQAKGHVLFGKYLLYKQKKTPTDCRRSNIILSATR